MTDNKFDGEFISLALGYLSDKLIKEAEHAHKKRFKLTWVIPAAALVLAALIVLPIFNNNSRINSIVPLDYNIISSIEYSAPLVTSTIITEPANAEDATSWLGFDLKNNLPDEMQSFDIKYTFVKNTDNDEILGVSVKGRLTLADYPKPGFNLNITKGNILADPLYAYERTTDVNGITVIAGVVPETNRTSQDGKIEFIPAQYYSSFDTEEYHCCIESNGQISEAAFSELNNILINLLVSAQ